MRTPTSILVGLLLPAGAAAQSLIQQIPPEYRQYAVTYEVRISFKGYTGLVEGAPSCQVDTTGVDVMVGTLTGVEIPAARDEDVVYTGSLRRTTRIDFCETKPGRSPDEPVWCVIKLQGSAAMEVELTVYGEADRGAWMKARAPAAPDTVRATGDCEPFKVQQVHDDYPRAEEGGGATPNGQDFDDEGRTPTGARVRLFNNGLARLKPGIFRPPPPNPSRGWTLEVIRRVP